MAKRVRRPKWAVSALPRVGRGALQLFEQHASVLARRVPPELVAGLRRDLDGLHDGQASVAGAGVTLRSATVRVAGAMERALDALRVARDAVRRSGASPAERAAFGISRRVAPNVASEVSAAVSMFLQGAAAKPKAVKRAGLVPQDLEVLRQLHGELAEAERAQETAKAHRKQPTVELQALRLRIEEGVDAIVSAGRLEFVAQPELARAFLALTPRRPQRRVEPPELGSRSQAV